MPKLATLTIALVLISAPAVAQPADFTRAMPEGLRAHIASETFPPLTTVASLPQGLKGELARLFREKSLQLADPGAPYNATDAVGPDPLPFRRLIAAGCAADHCLVHYERGGIAHTYAVLVLSRKGETIRLVWGGAPYGPLAGVKAVRDALAAGNVVGQTEYW